MEWMRDSVLTLAASSNHRNKILLGLNLYGYDYSPPNQMNAVIGKEYLAILEKVKGSSRLQWLEDAQEHVVEYSASGVAHKLFYPTLKVRYWYLCLIEVILISF